MSVLRKIDHFCVIQPQQRRQQQKQQQQKQKQYRTLYRWTKRAHLRPLRVIVVHYDGIGSVVMAIANPHGGLVTPTHIVKYIKLHADMHGRI